MKKYNNKFIKLGEKIFIVSESIFLERKAPLSEILKIKNMNKFIDERALEIDIRTFIELRPSSNGRDM